jgi:hypothetical protein
MRELGAEPTDSRVRTPSRFGRAGNASISCRQDRPARFSGLPRLGTRLRYAGHASIRIRTSPLAARIHTLGLDTGFWCGMRAMTGSDAGPTRSLFRTPFSVTALGCGARAMRQSGADRTHPLAFQGSPVWALGRVTREMRQSGAEPTH